MIRLSIGALALLGALVLGSQAQAQAPQVIYYGIGCGPLNGTPRDVPAIGTQGLPQIGQQFSITYTGPNHTVDFTQSGIQPFLMIGASPQNLVIPQFFFLLQPFGCALWVTPDFIIPMLEQRGLGRYDDTFPLTLPNSPALVGGLLYAQWFALFEQCGFVGCNYEYVLTSDAVNYIVGI